MQNPCKVTKEADAFMLRFFQRSFLDAASVGGWLGFNFNFVFHI